MNTGTPYLQWLLHRPGPSCSNKLRRTAPRPREARCTRACSRLVMTEPAAAPCDGRQRARDTSAVQMCPLARRPHSLQCHLIEPISAVSSARSARLVRARPQQPRQPRDLPNACKPVSSANGTARRTIRGLSRENRVSRPSGSCSCWSAARGPVRLAAKCLNCRHSATIPNRAGATGPTPRSRVWRLGSVDHVNAASGS